VRPDDATPLTIDELAAATGTTTRRIRSLQTLGLLAHPALRGRTGLYYTEHRSRLTAILHLQQKGFSLESLGLLFDAVEAGQSLAAVLGLPEPVAYAASAKTDSGDTDSAELYGFAELEPARVAGRRGQGRPLLSVVPTTVWDESEAS
jgi:DNA-binding transcriptional MerR regulator